MCSCTKRNPGRGVQEPRREPEGGVRDHRRSERPAGCERQARGLSLPLAAGRMLGGVVIDDTDLFNERLQEWETFYNFNRPHGAR